ncbi:MAG: AMP-binding protein, partial [Gammaproteobacteria bacterium]|nr:AMP-binding protein [Gammaproteobacteria bacterium]
AYGLTETSPAVTINPLTLKTYNGSIGLPLPSTDIAIRDDNGKDLSLGESGELCIKGPQVMSGYWQRSDESSLVFWPDGFLRTGDVAKINKKGFVFLVDRKKDMILVSGFNVYPNEVEQIISLMPGVLEVGVVGVEDKRGGETVKACIVKRDPTLTEKQVITHCRHHLTAYKVPKLLAFYDVLPKTNVGKVLRRQLK